MRSGQHSFPDDRIPWALAGGYKGQPHILNKWVYFSFPPSSWSPFPQGVARGVVTTTPVGGYPIDGPYVGSGRKYLPHILMWAGLGRATAFLVCWSTISSTSPKSSRRLPYLEWLVIKRKLNHQSCVPSKKCNKNTSAK